jgi:hypothetical protein
MDKYETSTNDKHVLSTYLNLARYIAIEEENCAIYPSGPFDMRTDHFYAALKVDKPTLIDKEE